RHHANDSRRLAPEQYVPTDHSGIPAVAILPDGPTQQDRRRGILALIRIFKRPSDCRVDSERPEEVRRDPSNPQLSRITIAADNSCALPDSGESAEERGISTQIDQFRPRQRPSRISRRRQVTPDESKLPGVLIGKRLNQRRIENAENRCIRANPQRERQDRNRCKPRAPDKRPAGKTNVLPHCVNSGHSRWFKLNTCTAES